MDNKTEAERSANMRAIRSTDTKPELAVRHLLFAAGFRYRLHAKNLPGKPDIVLPKWKTAVFVNGCFWHVHQGCSRAAKPGSNTEYWNAKLERNQARDREEHAALIAAGWRVVVVWECACRKKTLPALQALLCALIRDRAGPAFSEIGSAEVSRALSLETNGSDQGRAGRQA